MLLWIWISIACEEEGNRIAEQSGTNRAANQFQPEEQIRQTLPFLSFPSLPFPSLPNQKHADTCNYFELAPHCTPRPPQRYAHHARKTAQASASSTVPALPPQGQGYPEVGYEASSSSSSPNQSRIASIESKGGNRGGGPTADMQQQQQQGGGGRRRSIEGTYRCGVGLRGLGL